MELLFNIDRASDYNATIFKLCNNTCIYIGCTLNFNIVHVNYIYFYH